MSDPLSHLDCDDGSAREVSEDVLLGALTAGQKAIGEICSVIQELKDEVGKPEMEWAPPPADEALAQRVTEHVRRDVESAMRIADKEERNRALVTALSRKAQAPALPGADKIEAVYEHLRKEEQTTDWLAKLHAIGAATGVQLKRASYRTLKTDSRIVRYEIVLPAVGSYAQLREFLNSIEQETHV